MKWLKIFAVFVLLHAVGWIGSHVWMSMNPRVVVIIADTAYAMRPAFPEMRQWIDDYADSARYTQVLIGTDRAMLGPLAELRSTDEVFRTSFGRSSPEALVGLRNADADEHIVLTDGSLAARGWTEVVFDTDRQ